MSPDIQKLIQTLRGNVVLPGISETCHLPTNMRLGGVMLNLDTVTQQMCNVTVYPEQQPP